MKEKSQKRIKKVPNFNAPALLEQLFVRHVFVSNGFMMTSDRQLDQLVLRVRPFLDQEHVVTEVLSILKDVAHHDLFSMIRHYRPLIHSVCQDANRDRSEGDDDNEESPEESLVHGVCVIAYVSWSQEVADLLPVHFIPLIYSDMFIVHELIPVVIPFLERNAQNSISKGLTLLDKLLEHVGTPSLACFPPQFHDYLRRYPVHKTLIKVMRFSPEASHRRHAYNLFTRILHCFDRKGTFTMIDMLINEPCQVPGIIELSVREYRNLIILDNFASLSQRHLNQMIRRLITYCFESEEDEGLLDRNEALLGLLNFILFLMLRDPEERNDTGIWDLKDLLQQSLLSPVQNYLEDKKKSLLMDLEKCRSQDDKVKQNKLSFVKNMSLSIRNEPSGVCASTEDCPQDYEEQGIQMSLLKIDIIQSVVGRVSETLTCKEFK